MKWLGVKGYAKSLRNALEALNAVANNLDIPYQVRKEALKIHKKAFFKKLTRGRKTEALIGACLYIASKETDYPLSIKNLSNACSTSVKEIARNERFINRFVKTRKQITTASFISKFCHTLKLDETTLTQAIRNSKKIKGNMRNDVKAAVSIYLTGTVSIRKLSSVTGISRGHLGKKTKEICFLMKR